MLSCPLMLNNYQQITMSFPHLEDILVENSVLIKWLIKCKYVLFNACNMDSS